MSTIPVDSWIVENISLRKNDWGQALPVLSCVVSVHSSDSHPDTFRYFTPDGTDLFKIRYYETRVVLMPSFKVGSVTMTCGVDFDIADPEMMNRLESAIHSISNLSDYMSKLQSATKKMMEINRDIRHGRNCSAIAKVALKDSEKLDEALSFIEEGIEKLDALL